LGRFGADVVAIFDFPSELAPNFLVVPNQLEYRIVGQIFLTEHPSLFKRSASQQFLAFQ
jgi:hypothetical protein